MSDDKRSVFDFNPRSPRGERQKGVSHSYFYTYFNPRSPRGERPRGGGCLSSKNQFQSTLPARGATESLNDEYDAAKISIHAPREGSDNGWAMRIAMQRHFNPRSPRGERRISTIPSASDSINFNPRSPRGERLICRINSSQKGYISIHAPREGSDRFGVFALHLPFISIHAPREGSDWHGRQ